MTYLIDLPISVNGLLQPGSHKLIRAAGRAAGEIRRDGFESPLVSYTTGRFDAVSTEIRSELKARTFVVELVALLKRRNTRANRGLRGEMVP